MKTWMVVGALAAAAGIAGVVVWTADARRTETILDAGSPSFQWVPGTSTEDLELVLGLQAGHGQRVSAPPAPAGGRLLVMGVAGAAPSGGIVQVKNSRTGQSTGAIAAPDGSFELRLAIEEGDVLTIVALPHPALISAPEGAIAADSLTPEGVQAADRLAPD